MHIIEHILYKNESPINSYDISQNQHLNSEEKHNTENKWTLITCSGSHIIITANLFNIINNKIAYRTEHTIE
jgi:hypothetical protein